MTARQNQTDVPSTRALFVAIRSQRFLAAVHAFRARPSSHGHPSRRLTAVRLSASVPSPSCPSRLLPSTASTILGSRAGIGHAGGNRPDLGLANHSGLHRDIAVALRHLRAQSERRVITPAPKRCICFYGAGVREAYGDRHDAGPESRDLNGCSRRSSFYRRTHPGCSTPSTTRCEPSRIS